MSAGREERLKPRGLGIKEEISHNGVGVRRAGKHWDYYGSSDFGDAPRSSGSSPLQPPFMLRTRES